jgi:anti-sigma regulatory factor (Ser/Thr protein kinase)
MWRHDATPARVPAVLCGAPEPHTARAGVGNELRHAASSAAAGRMEVEVAAGQHAPAAARSAVEHWLSGRVSARLYDDVRLLVSELVTNSVRHAQLTRDMTIRISVALVDGAVRIEVEDPGNGATAAVAPDREHGGGFGLYLVELLAERWGATNDGTTCVWAELSLSPAT